MKKKSRVALIVVVTLLFVISGLLFAAFKQEAAAEPFVAKTGNHENKTTTVQPKSWKSSATLAAIGDILMHGRVYETALVDGVYDFKPMLVHVKDHLQQPDLLLANQETILGGIELGLSSYPSFNSPYEVGDAFIDAGVDIVSTANNHTLDRGERAIMNAINYYERVSLPYVGHFKDEKDKEQLRVLTTNGIDVAYLSYTYGTNGIPVPKGKDYLVNLIDKDVMVEEIKRANEVADVTVLSLHWGNEYQRYPTEDQKEFAQFLADAGVDILFGHHSHVLQPMEMLTAADGRDVFVVYSLGNFISGQVKDYKDIGGMASIEVTKEVTGDETVLTMGKPAFFPTYVASLLRKKYEVVPLLTADQFEFGLPQSKKQHDEIMDHMFQWIK